MLRLGDARTPIRWPQGYTARLDPLEVSDQEGRLVAREGDRISFGGGFGDGWVNVQGVVRVITG